MKFSALNQNSNVELAMADLNAFYKTLKANLESAKTRATAKERSRARARARVATL